MPSSVAETEVGASVETVWGVLLEKVERPDRFVVTAREARVLGKRGLEVERVMRFRDLELRERIRIDPEAHSILFTLLEHPIYEGWVVNRVEPAGEGRSRLVLERRWIPREPGQDPLDEADMERSLATTTGNIRRRAEELAEAGAGTRAEGAGRTGKRAKRA